MDEKTERAKLAAERRESTQWEKGFTACAMLFSGRYEDYAKERDKWIDIVDRAVRPPHR